MSWSPTTYQGHLITLRPPAESDVEDFLVRAGQPETTLAYGGDPSAIQSPTPASYKRSLARFPDSIKWVIDRQDHAIGGVRLHEIDEEEGHTRLAIGIWHPADWGHGYGTEASNLVIRHAFNVMNLHRVDLLVLESNQRAIRSYEKCGFKVEGILRERALVGGRRQNDLIMAILRHEFSNGLSAGAGTG